MRKIKSRILEVFDKDILIEMYKLQSKRFTTRMFKGKSIRTEYSANMKVKDMTKLLSDYLEKSGYSYSFPGAGTNRMTVLINGYIYKIALDQDGYIDNLNEFIMSKEAQPYVTKTYETNGLLAVAEYVTLISYEEFVEKKSKILQILDDISREYLIGDMGWTQKNYTNWGYRKNSDDLVILDFGHMHRLSGEKLLCRDCGQILQYNSTFTKLKCLSCGKEEEFMSIKARLSKKEERENIDSYLERAYILNTPQIEIKEDEVKDMSMYENYEEEEIVSRRFKQFAPKKGKYDHLLERRIEDATTINTLEDLSDEVNDKIMEDYMKVVKGQIKIKKSDKELQENKQILDPIKEEISEMDSDEASSYIYTLFIQDKINSTQYDYYMNYIENGDEDENEEKDDVRSEVVLDVVEARQPQHMEEDLYDEDSDKTYVFDDEDDLGIYSENINPVDVMTNRLSGRLNNHTINDSLDEGSFTEFMAQFRKNVSNEDTGEEEFEDDEYTEVLDFEIEDDSEVEEVGNIIRLNSTEEEPKVVETEVEVVEQPEDECSLKIKNSSDDKVVEVKAYQMSISDSNVEEVEMKIKLHEPMLSKEDVEKFKHATSNTNNQEVVTNKNLYESKQENNENEQVSLKIKKAEEVIINVTQEQQNDEKEDDQNKFNDGSIFLMMKEMQQKREEEKEKDYSHYEAEYAHLMDDEDDYHYPQRGRKKPNWK